MEQEEELQQQHWPRVLPSNGWYLYNDDSSLTLTFTGPGEKLTSKTQLAELLRGVREGNILFKRK